MQASLLQGRRPNFLYCQSLKNPWPSPPQAGAPLPLPHQHFHLSYQHQSPLMWWSDFDYDCFIEKIQIVCIYINIYIYIYTGDYTRSPVGEVPRLSAEMSFCCFWKRRQTFPSQLKLSGTNASFGATQILPLLQSFLYNCRLQSIQHWHYARLSVQCCSNENLNSFVFGRVVSFKTLRVPHRRMVALIHHLRSIKDVFMRNQRHHLRSIKDVFMRKERHQPHPTPPQPTPVLRSIKDVYMCKERHHLRSVKDVFMCKERHHLRSIKDVFTRKERHQPQPTPPQPTPLWPPANGYNHGYIYIYTFSKTDIAPENRPKPKKIVSSFNHLIFRCELDVSFKEG